MRLARLLTSCVLTSALAGCPSPQNHDTFVPGTGAVASWATTNDGSLRVPLAGGITWGAPTYPKDSLVKVRGEPGPTFVVVAVIADAPAPLALMTCAEAHRLRITKAVIAAGVLTTPPTLSDEVRKGERVPRVHYAVPLQANAGARAASTLSSWTYFLVGSLSARRCVGVGVTTIVRAKADDPQSPDPEDLQRFDHVFATAADGTVIAQ